MGGDKKKDNEKIDVLFDIAQIIELQKEADGSVKPFVSFKCPQTFEDDSSGASKAVPQFCFPDIGRFPCDDLESEFFSFVLTESDGDRRFGYCLRKLPPGHGKRFPVAYAVLSFFPCFTLYTKILEQIAFHYENSSLSKLNGFLTSVLDNRFPQPGESFVVKTANESGSFDNWNFTRPDDSDSLLDHADLETLLTVLTPHNVLTVFVGMLVERRIIFCSSKLSILSSCVQTAVALLYPFVWQHIYIPVLPKTLLSFCCAPMPFVVGILASSLDEVLGLPMDEVLLIDLDQNGFLLVPDANRGDAELLTSEQYESLTKVLKATSKLFKTIQKKKKRLTNLEEDKLTINQLDYESKRQKNLLKEMFLKFFVQIVGDYRQFINLEAKSFDRESFIAQQPPELQSLIEMLVMSQMFERFIEERIHSEKPNNGQFEAQIKLQKKVDLFSQQLSDAVSSSSGSSRQPKKNDIFSSLRRGVFGRDAAAPAPNDFNFVISDPKLVKSTNEVTTSSNSPLAMSSPSAPSSSLAAVLNNKPPPPPPKPKGALPPRMVIPTKALPTPPKQTSPSYSTFDSSPPSSPVHPPLGSSPSSSSSSSFIPQKSGSTGQIFDASLLTPLPASTPETPPSPNTAPRGRGRGRGAPLRPGPRGGGGGGGGGGGISSPRQMGSFEDDSALLASSSQPPLSKPRSQTTTQNSSAPSSSYSTDHPSSSGAAGGGGSPMPVLRERPARPPQNRNAICSSVPAAIAPINPSAPGGGGGAGGAGAPANGFASRPTPSVAPRPKPRPAPTGPPSGFQSRPTPSLPSSSVASTLTPAASPAPPPTRSPPSPDPSTLSSSSSASASGAGGQIPQIPPRTDASRRGPAPSPVGRPLPKPTPNPSSPL